MKGTLSLYDMICPLDFRFALSTSTSIEELRPYLSEEAFIGYLLKVEVALAHVLARRGVCPAPAAAEVEEAAQLIKAEEVYLEEKRIRHPVMALVNQIKARVSDKAEPYVHFTATSSDILCSADACRYRDFTSQILLPKLIALEKTLIRLAKREAKTPQIGRTHGQHAVPTTFGFSIAQYVSRLGGRILRLRDTSLNLRGKLSGAVGSYNASSLFVDDPEALEKEVLAELELVPSPISTQIVEAEFLVDYVHCLVSTFGVLANIADDMRHLQRSEIGEVEESFEEPQVGSSTMPQKKNPVLFENVKSLWKAFMPRMMTLYADQISEHQRDLTNLESSRFIPEIAVAVYIAVDILEKAMTGLAVRRDSMEENLRKSGGSVVAEPLHLLLSLKGCGNGHEKVRRLALESKEQGKDLRDLILGDLELAAYLQDISSKQREALENPTTYVGLSFEKTKEICEIWEKEIDRLKQDQAKKASVRKGNDGEEQVPVGM